MNGNLNFTDGQIVVRSITFDGIRIKGDDVYFEEEFEQGLTTLFSANSSNSQLKFELPQGSYSSIRIDFEAEESALEKIKLNGQFKNSAGDLIPLILEVERIEFYDKIAKDPQGNLNIDLVAGDPSTAIIQLNPVFWFSSISQNQLENAELISLNGVATIVINPSVNEHLYDLIQDKVNSNIEITID